MDGNGVLPEVHRYNVRQHAGVLSAHLRAGGYDPDVCRDDSAAIIDAVYSVFHEGSRGFILSGGTGCGKTTALRALRRLPVKGYDRDNPTYIPTTWIDCYHAGDADWLDWEEAAATIARSRLLLLDDFGTDEPTMMYGKRVDRIARLVMDWAEFPNRWPSNRTALVVATNLTGDQVQERYGERVMSRLRALTPVVLHAGDMRTHNNNSTHTETTEQ